MHLEEDRFVFNTYHERFLHGPLGEQIFAKTMLGYYRSLAACASVSHNILADTGFYSRALVDQCAQELAGLQVWLLVCIAHWQNWNVVNENVVIEW
jgi:chloramphenicol 3-O-phosphotransferase